MTQAVVLDMTHELLILSWSAVMPVAARRQMPMADDPCLATSDRDPNTEWVPWSTPGRSACIH
jgi:hypothetical protein